MQFFNDKKRAKTGRKCNERLTMLLSSPQNCICCVSNLFSGCFTHHNACCTQAEQSERKANSFKIGSEITNNWRPFKSIITVSSAGDLGLGNLFD